MYWLAGGVKCSAASRIGCSCAGLRPTEAPLPAGIPTFPCVQLSLLLNWGDRYLCTVASVVLPLTFCILTEPAMQQLHSRCSWELTLRGLCTKRWKLARRFLPVMFRHMCDINRRGISHIIFFSHSKSV